MGSVPPSGTSLAAFLARERSTVLGRWRVAVRRLPPARTLDRERLLNHLPNIYDRVVEMVADAEHGRHVRPPGSQPEEHAIERLAEGYDLGSVVDEYAVLRECILQLRAEQGVGAVGLPILNGAIDQAIRASVARYESARHRTLIGLDRISAAALEQGDARQLLEAMQHVLVESTEAIDSAAIHLRVGDELRLVAAVGLEAPLVGQRVERVGSLTPAGTVAASGSPLELTESGESPLVDALLRDAGARAFYGVPMRQGDGVVGVAHIASCSAAAFSTEDKLLFRLMVERATSGILQFRLRDELLTERRRLQAVLDVLPVAVTVLDAAGKRLMMNRAATALWGRDAFANEGLPRVARAAYRNDEVPLAPEEWALARALRLGEQVRDQELEIETVDRRKLTVLSSAAPIIGDEGAILGAVGVSVDLTERRALEEERRRAVAETERSLAILDALFASSPLGLAFFDPRLRYVRVNEALAKVNGLPAQAHTGHTVRELLPEVADVVEPLLRHVMETGRPLLGIEVSAAGRADPENVRSLSLNHYPARGPDGKMLGVGAAVVDVTERREAEERLRLSEERLRLIIDALEDYAIYTIDPEGRISSWSRGASKVKGYRANDILGRPYATMFPPELVAKGEPQRLIDTATREGVARGEGLRRRADGRLIEVAYSMHPLRDADGRVRAFVKVARDITREKAQARRTVFLDTLTVRLTRSLDPDATLGQFAGLAVPELADSVIVDLVEKRGELRRVFVRTRGPERQELANRAFRRSTTEPGHSYPRETFQSATPHLIRAVDDEILARVAKDPEHLAAMKRFGFCSALVLPMVARQEPVGVVTLVMDQSKRHYDEEDLAFGIDLASRLALAIDNARLHRSVEEAVRARDDFVAVASHDLRNPLTSLALEVSSVARRARRCGEGDLTCEWAEERAGRMAAQIDRMRALIEELLDVSRIQAGRLNLSMRELDLAALVREVTTRLEKVAKAAGCELVVEAAQPMEGLFDAARIDQVLTNLVTNATKYGTGRPVRVTLVREGNEARLSVRDEGVGIAPENHERIFRRFERAGDQTAFQGTGLGLWIVAQVVAAHGGTIRVDSTLGHGATFVVTLPLRGES